MQVSDYSEGTKSSTNVASITASHQALLKTFLRGFLEQLDSPTLARAIHNAQVTLPLRNTLVKGGRISLNQRPLRADEVLGASQLSFLILRKLLLHLRPTDAL